MNTRAPDLSEPSAPLTQLTLPLLLLWRAQRRRSWRTLHCKHLPPAHPRVPPPALVIKTSLRCKHLPPTSMTHPYSLAIRNNKEIIVSSFPEMLLLAHLALQTITAHPDDPLLLLLKSKSKASGELTNIHFLCRRESRSYWIILHYYTVH